MEKNLSNKEILEIAWEVIAGLWGDGKGREASLSNLFGRYNAYRIQEAVNRLMGAFNGT